MEGSSYRHTPTDRSIDLLMRKKKKEAVEGRGGRGRGRGRGGPKYLPKYIQSSAADECGIVEVGGARVRRDGGGGEGKLDVAVVLDHDRNRALPESRSLPLYVSVSDEKERASQRRERKLCGRSRSEASPEYHKPCPASED